MDVAGAVPPESAQRLPRAAGSYLRIRSVLETVSFAAAAVAAVALLAPHHWLAWGVAAAAVGVVLVLAVDFLLVIPRRLRFTHFTMEATCLQLWRGSVFRSHVIIPRDMVMNIELRQGPLAGAMKLSTLRISTVMDIQGFGPIDDATADELRRRFELGSTASEWSVP